LLSSAFWYSDLLTTIWKTINWHSTIFEIGLLWLIFMKLSKPSYWDLKYLFVPSVQCLVDVICMLTQMYICVKKLSIPPRCLDQNLAFSHIV
jgi:hypothetical protein